MSNSSPFRTSNSSTRNSSAFVKQSYKRGMAIVGTSSIVLGFGLSGGSAAFASAEIDCIGRTITPGTPSQNEMAIYQKLNDGTGIVCLNGDFVIEHTIIFENGDVTVYGIGDSSIESSDSAIFFSAADNEDLLYNIEINNLTVKNSIYTAVLALSVDVNDSTFSGNQEGAILAYGYVSVDNSTFINNSGENGSAIQVDNGTFGPPQVSISNSTFEGNHANGTGGAILAYGVEILNSTFVENTATVGGAVAAYYVDILNSTFADNEAVGGEAEGGAIHAFAGQVGLSTFVNNRAGEPTPVLDVPGNAIYKQGDGTFAIAGNIFAGTSPHPQLGTGAVTAPSPFEDFGGNVFSTSAVTEEDVDQHQDSIFDASLTSLFGTTSPMLASHAPNTSGTETFGLAAGSPAIDILTAQLISGLAVDERAEFDQRGATRSIPLDAGAFEGSIHSSLATTGSANPWWVTVSSSAMLAIGGFMVVIANRLSRRRFNS